MIFRIIVLLVSLIFLQSCESTSVKGNPERATDDYVQLGQGYLSEGRREQARFNLLRALEIDPLSAPANSLIAVLYQSQKENELAEKHYLIALEEDKSLTQARYNYALFLYRQDRFEDARYQYKIISNEVNYRLRYQAFLGLGLSEKHLGNFSGAEEALLRSMSLNPRGSAAIELAELKLEQQDYVLAKEYLDLYEQRNQASPQSLQIGLKLAEKFGDPISRASYVMGLKSMYPDSRQARELILSEQSDSAQ